MARYLKLADGTTPNLYEVRTQLPGMGIPEGADLSEFGYMLITETEKPKAADKSKVKEEIKLVAGKYTTVYTQVPLTADEIETARKAGVPQEVAMYKFQIALAAAGRLKTVDTALLKLSESVIIQWQRAATVNRNSAFILLTGLTAQQLDDAFIAAALVP